MKSHTVVARVFALVVVSASAVFGLAACSSSSESDQPVPSPQVDAPLPRPEPAGTTASSKDNSSGGGMFGMFGGGDQKGVGVNEFLWRASLDTLHFMPMDSADPYAGVIKTNWYSASQSPNQRLKVTVFILDTRLRTDALRVSVFQQTKDTAGNWADSTVDPDTTTKIENLILTRARELKLAAD
jgi:hypothetical protein